MTRIQLFWKLLKSMSKNGQLKMKATSYMNILDFATKFYANGDS